VFGVILIFAVTLMQGYVFWRAASVPFVRHRISRKHLFGLGIILWATFLLVVLLARRMRGTWR